MNLVLSVAISARNGINSNVQCAPPPTRTNISAPAIGKMTWTLVRKTAICASKNVIKVCLNPHLTFALSAPTPAWIVWVRRTSALNASIKDIEMINCGTCIKTRVCQSVQTGLFLWLRISWLESTPTFLERMSRVLAEMDDTVSARSATKHVRRVRKGLKTVFCASLPTHSSIRRGV